MWRAFAKKCLHWEYGIRSALYLSSARGLSSTSATDRQENPRGTHATTVNDHAMIKTASFPRRSPEVTSVYGLQVIAINCYM